MHIGGLADTAGARDAAAARRGGAARRAEIIRGGHVSTHGGLARPMPSIASRPRRARSGAMPCAWAARPATRSAPRSCSETTPTPTSSGAWPARSSSTRWITWTFTCRARKRTCARTAPRFTSPPTRPRRGSRCWRSCARAARSAWSRPRAWSPRRSSSGRSSRATDRIDRDRPRRVHRADRRTTSPSHIVKPIIHKDRREIANSSGAHGLGAYDDTPEVITRRARAYLRNKFLHGRRRHHRRATSSSAETRAPGAGDQRGQLAG